MEEKKQEQTQEQSEPEKKGNFRVFLKICLGLVLLVLGVAALLVWKNDFFSLVKACIGPILILSGIIAIAIARD